MTDMTEFLRMLAALLFVLGLMGGLAFLLKKFGLSGHIAPRGKAPRLKIIEALPLDGRRRLMLVQRDDVQHLVIVGPTTETVIETDIKPKDNQAHE